MSPSKKRPVGYRNYSSDGTYWTVRKQGKVYWVVRIDVQDGEYWAEETWGGYQSAGAAAGAAAQLAYRQGKKDAADEIRKTLHKSLDRIGLGVPEPQKPPVAPKGAPRMAGADDEGQLG